MRVGTDAREDCARMRLRQCQRVFTGSQVASWINNAGHAALKGSVNDGFTVGIETGGIDVGMTIDEQRVCPFQLLP